MYDELDHLRDIIRALIRMIAPGRYRLSDVLGDAWSAFDHKAALGAWFKQAVVAGQFPGVEPIGKTARNHQVYYVDGRSA
jgi:hypothetical protein